MTEPLERRADSNPVARTFTVFAILVLLAVVVLAALLAMTIRLNTLVDDNRQSNRYIIECTTPGPSPPPRTGHRCFDDGQARTAAAIKQIVDAIRGGK